QLGRLPGWTAARIHNAEYFNEKIESVKTPTVVLGNTHVYHQYTVRVPDGVDRDAVTKRLNEKGIGVRVYYPIPIHKQPVFQQMEGVQLVGVVDQSAANATKVGNRLNVPFYTDWEKLLEEQKPDLVSCAVPTSLHFDVGTKLIERGLNVLMEKPITSTLDQAE